MPPESVSWYVLYKPAGVVTTLDDPQGRPTVLGLLGAIPTRVFPIGRLDWDAEGALLLTDDGAAAHRLLHPSFQVPRTYLAKVKGVPTDESLARLVSGVRLEDGPARALEVARFQAVERNTWLKLVVGEGRPHLVKRLCAAIGHPVVRLFRPHQAGISVAGMQPGELRPLRPEELAVIEAVAAGRPVPPMTLSLPARRHGRADDDELQDSEEASTPRPPKPPRFGTRQWRNAPEGGGEVRKARDARPPGPGFERGGARGAQRPDKRAPWAAGRTTGPSRGAGTQRPPRPGERPPRRGEGAPKDARGGTDARGFGRGPPGARPDTPGRSPREAFGRREGGGRDFHAKPPGRSAFPAARRGPPGGRPDGREGTRGGFGPRAGGDFRAKPSAGRGSFSPGRRGPPGRDAEAGREGFGGKPANGRGGFSSARRGPPGGRPGAPERRPPGRGGGFGRGFGAKEGPGQGGRPGVRRGPPGAASGFERGRAPNRGPPAGRGGPDPRRGPPGGRPGAPWTGGAGTAKPSGARPGHGQGGRGRPPESRRGPPRPRGGAPRPRR
jgi:23S rRNA pseudouridine2605 synthase